MSTIKKIYQYIQSKILSLLWPKRYLITTGDHNVENLLTTYLDITKLMKDKVTSEIVQAVSAGDLDITIEQRNKLIAVISAILSDVSATGYETLQMVAQQELEKKVTKKKKK